MTARSPRQVLLFLDLQQTLAIEDVKSRLPEAPEEEAAAPKLKVLQLSRCPIPAWPTARLPTVGEWQEWARQLATLVAELHDFQGRDQANTVELYIAGDAPLPLFVQLGQLLAKWRRPIVFLELSDPTSAQRKWDELHIPEYPPPAGTKPQPRRFFDSRVPADLSTLPSTPDPFTLRISTRGIGGPRPSAAQDSEPSAASRTSVELGTQTFKPLSSSTVSLAQSELADSIRHCLAVASPKALATIQVLGTRALAFLAGRALPQAPRDLAIPYWTNHGWHTGLTLPLPPPPPQEPEQIHIFLAYYAPPGQAPYHALAEEFKSHIASINKNQPYRIIIEEAATVPLGADSEKSTRAIVYTADIVIAFISSSFITSPLSDLILHANFPDERLIPVLERAVSIDAPWGKRQFFPRDGRPMHARKDRDLLWVELAEEVDKRCKQIALNNLNRNLSDRYQSAAPRPLSRETASTASEYLDALKAELVAIPRLRCTYQERYQAWYGLVHLVDQLGPGQRIVEKLDARPVASGYANQPEDPGPPAAETCPENPLHFFLQYLDIKDAAEWLFVGIVEFGPQTQFPRRGNETANLEAALRGLSIPLTASQESWIKASRIAHEAGCPSLLASFGPHQPYEPPLDELEAVLHLLRAFRQGEPLPDLPPDLQAVRSQMLLNLIAAQAWFRGDTQRALQAYREARQRAVADQDAVSEWVAVLGIYLLLQSRRIKGAGADIEVPEVAAVATQLKHLEKDPAVAKLKSRIDQFWGSAKDGLLDLMQRAQADSMPTVWADSLHFAIREYLLDQEELGQPPGWVGASAELLTTAILLTPDGVLGTSRLEGVELLCRYGHSRELKDRDSSGLFKGSPDTSTELFDAVLRPGRTPGEWFARSALLAQNLSDLPISLVPKAHEFYSEFLSFTSKISHYDLDYLHGTMQSNLPIDFKINNLMFEIWGFIGFDQIPNEYLQKHFLSSAENRRLMFLSNIDNIGDTEWPTQSVVGIDNLSQLATVISDFLSNISDSYIFSRTQANPSRHKYIDVRIDQIPLGISSLIRALKGVSGADQLQHSLAYSLHRVLCAGLDRDYRFFLPVSLREDILSLLLEQGIEIESILDIVLRHLEAAVPGINELDGFSLLAHNYKFLTLGQQQKLAELLRQRADELLKLADQPGAARPLLWLAAALLHQTAGLRELGQKFLEVCPADPYALVAVAALPEPDLDTHQAVIDQAVRHCLQGQPADALPWFTPTAQPGQRRFLDQDAVELHGINAVHNFLWFHPRRALPKRWVSLVLAQLFSRDKGCVHGALQVLDLALCKQPDRVNLDTARTGLAHVLRYAAAPRRDNALRILVRHRGLFEADDADALRALLAPYDPPRTLGTRWAWQLGEAQRERE